MDTQPPDSGGEPTTEEARPPRPAPADPNAGWAPGTHDPIPVIPHGTALFEGIPAPAIVVEALAPVIGNGCLVSRRSGSVGAILVKNSALFEVYAYENGDLQRGAGAASHRRLDRRHGQRLPARPDRGRGGPMALPRDPLLPGPPSRVDRLEGPPRRPLRARGPLRGGDRHPDRPRGHPDRERPSGGHLHREAPRAGGRGSSRTPRSDQARNRLGPPRNPPQPRQPESAPEASAGRGGGGRGRPTPRPPSRRSRRRPPSRPRPSAGSTGRRPHSGGLSRRPSRPGRPRRPNPSTPSRSSSPRTPPTGPGPAPSSWPRWPRR